MSAQENKAHVRAMIEQVWNAGQPERLAEFWADGSREMAAGLHEMLTAAFPDLRIRIDDLVAEEDRVVARLSFSGTHRGDFQGIAATGRPIEFGAIRIYQLADGKVVDTWAQQDSMGLFAQLRD